MSAHVLLNLSNELGEKTITCRVKLHCHFCIAASPQISKVDLFVPTEKKGFNLLRVWYIMHDGAFHRPRIHRRYILHNINFVPYLRRIELVRSADPPSLDKVPFPIVFLFSNRYTANQQAPSPG